MPIPISVGGMAKGNNLGCYGSQRFPHHNHYVWWWEYVNNALEQAYQAEADDEEDYHIEQCDEY